VILLLHGDALEGLKKLEDNSVDSIVTDPPYGLKFMGKRWDYDVPSIEVWEECLRVLKPGGYLLSFAGTRTQHRMAVNIEDAGFEIRDMIAWVYGSGFPKSHNISKALDKEAGVEREVIGKNLNARKTNGNISICKKNGSGTITAPATDEAKQWDGWGTALKPALEPITVARKPLSEKTIAKNILKWGTSGINIDGCRIEMMEKDREEYISKRKSFENVTGKVHGNIIMNASPANSPETKIHDSRKGRFPANLIHDGSEEVEALFPQNAGASAPVKGTENSVACEGNITGKRNRVEGTFHNDSGSAARFFYCAKASKEDRGKGNNHPTVKPTDLMRYLVRLVTPKGGICLDPYMGSGTTGKGCKLENFSFIGIENVKESFDIAKKRIDAELYQTVLF